MLKYGRKVISPIYAEKLSDALGKVDGISVLSRILRSPFRMRDGSEDDTYELRDREILELKNHPFVGKGMTWLREHFDEVIDYYEKRKPAKAAIFHELKLNKDKVFTSSIAVFSSILRIELPGNKDEKLFKMKVNTYFQSIIQTVNKINSYDPEDAESEKVMIQIDKLLASAQEEISDLFMAIFKILDGKRALSNRNSLVVVMIGAAATSSHPTLVNFVPMRLSCPILQQWNSFGLRLKISTVKRWASLLLWPIMLGRKQRFTMINALRLCLIV